MVIAILIAISLMWIPVGLFLLGKGEAKTTGWIALFVGICTVICAIIHAGFLKDNIVGGFLFGHGLVYLITGAALITGTEDLRTVANTALAMGIICVIYAIMWFFGGPFCEGGKPLVGQNNYLALCAIVYAILYFEILGLGYGKVGAPVLGWSLFVGVILGLWIPAFWLMLTGTLPLCH